MHGVLEFAAHRSRMSISDTSDQHPLFRLHQPGRNFDHLLGSFTGAENHFGKTTAQRPVRIDLGKAEIGDRRSLERAQHFVAFGAAAPEFTGRENATGSQNGHGEKMARLGATERD
jgi:hypothetical protein